MQNILIDGGPDSTVLEKLGEYMPFWDKEIDLVILTHPDSDHVTGLIDVLQKYKVDNILWTGISRDGSTYQQWLNVLAKQKKMGAKIIIAQSGEEIKAGNVLYRYFKSVRFLGRDNILKTTMIQELFRV